MDKIESLKDSMLVYTITETDLLDNDKCVIGVCTSIENVNKLIDKYYGGHTELSFKDIRDSGLEFKKKLLVDGIFGSHEVEIIVESFVLNGV